MSLISGFPFGNMRQAASAIKNGPRLSPAFNSMGKDYAQNKTKMMLAAAAKSAQPAFSLGELSRPRWP